MHAGKVSTLNINGNSLYTFNRYYQSFHGKDFKALAQIALFILWEELSDDQQSVWLSLSKVIKGGQKVAFNLPFSSVTLRSSA